MLELAYAAALLAAAPSDWTPPVEVRAESEKCVSYRARLAGEYLIVQAQHEPGWHTYAMDNKKRAEEKLAGRPSLGLEKPTEISISGGLELAGPWRQTPPKDMSRPELLWFTWGFEGQAEFAAKVRVRGAEPARIGVRGQACKESTCKNIDVEFLLPPQATQASAQPDLKHLIPVR